MIQFYCLMCGYEAEKDLQSLQCPRCGSPLVARYAVSREHYLSIIRAARNRRELGVWSFYPLIPVPKMGPSLGEGWTPEVKLEHVAHNLGLNVLIAKNEAANPTGTFVDRGAAIDVWWAKLKGFRKIVVPALGDFAVAAASYGVKAGIEVLAILPRGVERGKLYRILLTGARIELVDSYRRALERARRIATTYGFYLSLTLSTMVIEGYRTIVLEIVERLRNGLDYVVMPVGEGVLATAIYKGLQEVHEVLNLDVPTIVLVQLSTIHRFKTMEMDRARIVEVFRDIIVETPTAMNMAMEAIKRSNGLLSIVDELMVFETAYRVARSEGLVLDPIGVVGLAGLQELLTEGVIERGSKVLVIMSGSPSKDPFTLYRILERDLEALKKLQRLEGEEPQLSVIEIEILRLLAEERALHAYAIWKKLRSRGFSIALSTVLYHVKKLEEKGLVRILERSNRRIVYTVTEDGLAVLRKLSS